MSALQDLISGSLLSTYNEEEDFDYVLSPEESSDEEFTSEGEEVEEKVPKIEPEGPIAFDLTKSDEDYYDSEEEEEIRALAAGGEENSADCLSSGEELEEEEKKEEISQTNSISKTKKILKSLKKNNTSNAMELIQNMKRLIFLSQEEQLQILNFLNEKNIIEFNILLQNSFSLYERSKLDSPQRPLQISSSPLQSVFNSSSNNTKKITKSKTQNNKNSKTTKNNLKSNNNNNNNNNNNDNIDNLNQSIIIIIIIITI